MFYGADMTFKEFRGLADTYNLIPVQRTILADELTPVSAYLRIRREFHDSFLFESVEGTETIARYSFIGCGTRMLIHCSDGITSLSVDGCPPLHGMDLFGTIRETTGSWNCAPVEGLPRFSGGLVGFIGYDTIRFIETVPQQVTNDARLPDAILGLFKSLIIFDHLRHQVTLTVHAEIRADDNLRESFDAAQTELAQLEHFLLFPAVPPQRFYADHSNGSLAVRNEMTKEEFNRMISMGKEHIRLGDVFQVVLSQRFSVSCHGDPFNVYRALRVINPSPYLYFLDIGGTIVVGSSPEILVRIENGHAEVYPIAGTRPRGRTPEEDRTLGQELLSDAKERAEHVMLVDLGRNDLGRVCIPGSISVDPFMSIVRYSHVMHIASRIRGKLKQESDAVDVFRAAFPAGTVSGAPKIRAMEIIDELERSRRCLYAGGVGYFDFSGNMDFCIAIRTLVVSESRIYFQAGAGIVADSVPEREYEETLTKARVLVDAVTMAEGIGQ